MVISTSLLYFNSTMNPLVQTNGYTVVCSSVAIVT